MGACELYIFTVGIIGPIGIGPISNNIPTVRTYYNKRAPPKNLTVSVMPGDDFQMLVQWAASCQSINEPVDYIITVHEKIKDLWMSFTKPGVNTVEVSHGFTVTFGAVYEVKVSTALDKAVESPVVVYHAPSLLPPFEFQIIKAKNGSYVAYWQEHSMSHTQLSFDYEVLVSEGSLLNETTAWKFKVSKPPFVFDNVTADVYSFGIKLVTSDGYKSAASEVRSIWKREQASWSDNIPKSSLTTVLILVLVLLVLVGGALGFLYVRHRRLQNSFTRFANSHYDTRSDAATFDSLDEEETPQINRFSDDEPLVIA